MRSDTFRIGLGRGVGGGGDNDHIVTQTPRTISGKAVLRCICNTFVMSSHQTYFWTLRTRPWHFGGLSAKTRTWVGGSLFRSGMMTTLFRGHPEQCLHTLAHTPANPPTPRSGLRQPPPRTASILFSMLIRSLAPGFSSVKTFLAASAFCTVFTAFSYYPTTCDLAVSSLSSFKRKCGRCVLPNNSLSPDNTLSTRTSTLPSNEEKNAAPRRDPKRQF